MKTLASLLLQPLALTITVALAAVAQPRAAIQGDYLEVRSCDVYTGACVANSEMGLSGKEGILVWSVRKGEWNNVALDGLNVIAVVRTTDTLGDLKYAPRRGEAVLLVDQRATDTQKTALIDFARSMAGSLVADVLEIREVPMTVSLGTCDGSGCARVKAGTLVEVSTRCLGGKDHLCGNEDLYYPPLTTLRTATPAYTELAAYRGSAFNLTWELAGQRGVYLGTFAR